MSVAPATSQPQPQHRPRTRSILTSFGSTRSRKSHKNSGSIEKIDLKESSAEKARGRIKSKADPTLAVNEEEPAALAAKQQSNLPPLRSMQHKDQNGNVIADPDRSNPTRNRWERPLDTIRSFQAAADGNFDRRLPSRPVTQDGLSGYNRRYSYHQGASPSRRCSMTRGKKRDGCPLTRRHPPPAYHHQAPSRAATDHGYYGHRMSSSRPESYVDGYGHQGTPYRPRFVPSRMTSDAAGYGPRHGPPVYPSQSYHRSYDTVTSGSGGSHNSTDQWGNSTDPSSENSSVDRIQQAPPPPPPPKQPDLGEAYGFTGFGDVPPLDTPTYDRGPVNYPVADEPQRGPASGVAEEVAPRVPPHLPAKDSAYAAGGPNKLGSSNSSAGSSAATPESKEKKRKGWFRRFSKG
ncbi:MAG: hypothetical protein M1815_002408 [Lichina confinis]|nr:MAG: hypothetical protein M1815_002408 [Lichina confinis]